MKFPSEEFYNDSLRIASDEPYRSRQQERSELTMMWARNSNPIKFIDVVGEEQTRSVATQDSAPQSKYNSQEVRVAVSWLCFCITGRAAWTK